MKKEQGEFYFTRKEEDRARRVARSNGLRVCKSRDRYYHGGNRGGLQLVEGNTVIAGVNFDCSPEGIIYFAEHHNR
jgi:hypothetical protein